MAELWAGQSGRAVQQGYSAADGVRQQFTGKERDNETGLDYSVHRYYAPAQGRFTSADPVFIASARLSDPQTLNLYAYARNNPLRYTDPDGLYLVVHGLSADVMRYLSELERLTGLKLKWDPKSGIVSLDGPPPANLNANAQEVLNLIQDPTNHVVMEVINDPQGKDPDKVVVGRLLGAGRHPNPNRPGDRIAFHKIDLSDLDKFNKPGGTTQGDLVIHETIEAYHAAQTATKVLLPGVIERDKIQWALSAHRAGLDAENRNREPAGRGTRGGTVEGFLTNPPQYGGQRMRNPDGDFMFVIDFSNHVEALIIDGGNESILKDVQVTKKP